MRSNPPPVEVGDIWYTPSYGEVEYYELILKRLDANRFFVLNLLTGDTYDCGINIYHDAVKVG